MFSSIGDCSNTIFIETVQQKVTYYFAVSSSRADAGDFTLMTELTNLHQILQAIPMSILTQVELSVESIRFD